MKSLAGWRYLLGSVVVGIFVWQLVYLSPHWEQLTINRAYLLLLIPLLTLVAWGGEWLKWNLGCKAAGVHHKETKIASFQKGMLTGFITPAALGNFVGRLDGFQKAEQSTLLTHTFMGNGAQFLASIGLGLVGLHFFASQFYLYFPVWVGFLALLLPLVGYFFIRKMRFFRWTWNIAEVGIEMRFVLLILSVVRLLAFLFQLSILLTVFTGHFNVDYLFMSALFYLFTTLSPSVFVGKLLVRESIALWLFPLLGVSGMAALFATSLMWLVNNGLTALWALRVFHQKRVNA